MTIKLWTTGPPLWMRVRAGPKHRFWDCALSAINVTVQAYWTISSSLSVSADIQVTAKLAAPNAPLGYSLCSLNLIFDGYTNAMQVRPLSGPSPMTRHACTLCKVVCNGCKRPAVDMLSRSREIHSSMHMLHMMSC